MKPQREGFADVGEGVAGAADVVSAGAEALEGEGVVAQLLWVG